MDESTEGRSAKAGGGDAPQMGGSSARKRGSSQEGCPRPAPETQGL